MLAYDRFAVRHETGHILNGDLYTWKAITSLGIFLTLPGTNIWSPFWIFPFIIGLQAFNRQTELWADRRAAKTLSKQEREFVAQFFESLPSTDHNWIVNLIKPHPSSKERAKRIREIQ